MIVSLCGEMVLVRSVFAYYFLIELHTIGRSLVIALCMYPQYCMMIGAASSTDEFVMIHLRDDVMMTEHFTVFVELLSDADDESFFVAGCVDDDVFIVYLLC